MKKPTITELDGPLQLTSSKGLRLFFIGVGTAFTKKKYQTNLLIIKGDEHILIDCGTLCPLALTDYGIGVMDINTYLITHTHADHIGGLEEAMLMGRYVKRKKPALVVPEEFAPSLWETSLKGGAAYNECHDGRYLELKDMFEVHYPEEVGSEPRPLFEINRGDLNLKIYRTKHIPDSAEGWKDSFYSYGLLIDEKVIFTSDTRYDPELLEWLTGSYRSVKWIFHDCQLAFTGGVHASLAELKQLKKSLRKKIFFTHYADSTEGYDVCKEGFAGFARQGVYYDFD